MAHTYNYIGTTSALDCAIYSDMPYQYLATHVHTKSHLVTERYVHVDTQLVTCVDTQVGTHADTCADTCVTHNVQHIWSLGRTHILTHDVLHACSYIC